MMKIRKETLCNMLERLNAYRGFVDYEYNTIGIYRLQKDINGYSVREVMNESGGLRIVGNLCGMSTRECYFFLSGIIESAQTNK